MAPSSGVVATNAKNQKQVNTETFSRWQYSTVKHLNHIVNNPEQLPRVIKQLQLLKMLSHATDDVQAMPKKTHFRDGTMELNAML